MASHKTERPVGKSDPKVLQAAFTQEFWGCENLTPVSRTSTPGSQILDSSPKAPV